LRKRERKSIRRLFQEKRKEVQFQYYNQFNLIVSIMQAPPVQIVGPGVVGGGPVVAPMTLMNKLLIVERDSRRALASLDYFQDAVHPVDCEMGVNGIVGFEQPGGGRIILGRPDLHDPGDVKGYRSGHPGGS
jgi:hypothetical protein